MRRKLSKGEFRPLAVCLSHANQEGITGKRVFIRQKEIEIRQGCGILRKLQFRSLLIQPTLICSHSRRLILDRSLIKELSF